MTKLNAQFVRHRFARRLPSLCITITVASFFSLATTAHAQVAGTMQYESTAKLLVVYRYIERDAPPVSTDDAARVLAALIASPENMKIFTEDPEFRQIPFFAGVTRSELPDLLSRNATATAKPSQDAATACLVELRCRSADPVIAKVVTTLAALTFEKCLGHGKLGLDEQAQTVNARIAELRQKQAAFPSPAVDKQLRDEETALLRIQLNRRIRGFDVILYEEPQLGVRVK